MFQLGGPDLGWQLLGLLLAFFGLILANEFARRSKAGGIICFIGIPAVLSVFFIVLYVCAGMGMQWALENQTYLYMNSWFHYAKLYAATAGCIGFMLLKYRWGIGKTHWFKCFPFVIVAINILIAVMSDFESALHAGWWQSSEGVWLYGGWWNWINGIAGLINIFCMTGWFCIYSSKNEEDMLWPDMTIWFIVAYDVWNFTYTYLNLPNHSWYCGVALLLAPTVVALLWNKGGWIQNRAFTLAVWCMFAQMFPLVLDKSAATVLPSVYPQGFDAMGSFAPSMVGNNVWQILWSFAALAVNIVVIGVVIYRSLKQQHNPYTKPIFEGTKYFNEAMERAE